MKEECEEGYQVWEKAVELSNVYGPLIIEEVDGMANTATTTAAVLLSSFCVSANISMHEAVDLLMTSYKEVLRLRNEEDK